MGFSKDACEVIQKFPDAKTDIYFLHGFGSNRNHIKDIANTFKDKYKANLILCDARGHGKNKNGKISDWHETIKDYQNKINTNSNNVILIGHSMGGAMSLTLGNTNPKVKQVFAIAAPHGKDLFTVKLFDWYEFGGIRDRLELEQFESITKSLPEHVNKCRKENRSKFFLIHGEHDSIVPISELDKNQKDLCIPDSNVLVLPYESVFPLSHVQSAYHPKTIQFIHDHLEIQKK